MLTLLLKFKISRRTIGCYIKRNGNGLMLSAQMVTLWSLLQIGTVSFCPFNRASYGNFVKKPRSFISMTAQIWAQILVTFVHVDFIKQVLSCTINSVKWSAGLMMSSNSKAPSQAGCDCLPKVCNHVMSSINDFLHLIYIAESCFLELLFSMFSTPAFPFS